MENLVYICITGGKKIQFIPMDGQYKPTENLALFSKGYVFYSLQPNQILQPNFAILLSLGWLFQAEVIFFLFRFFLNFV